MLARFTFGLHVPCPKCKLAGKVAVRTQVAKGKWRTDKIPCRRCNAAGYLVKVDGRLIADPFAQ